MDNNKSWHYINLEDFEFKIRQEEREKEYQRRCRERSNRKKQYLKRRKLFIKSIPYRVIGLVLIVLSTRILHYDTDGTFALLTMPLGLLTLLCPLSSVDADMEKDT